MKMEEEYYYSFSYFCLQFMNFYIVVLVHLQLYAYLTTSNNCSLCYYFKWRMAAFWALIVINYFLQMKDTPIAIRHSNVIMG